MSSQPTPSALDRAQRIHAHTVVSACTCRSLVSVAGSVEGDNALRAVLARVVRGFYGCRYQNWASLLQTPCALVIV